MLLWNYPLNKNFVQKIVIILSELFFFFFPESPAPEIDKLCFAKPVHEKYQKRVYCTLAFTIFVIEM